MPLSSTLITFALGILVLIAPASLRWHGRSRFVAKKEPLTCPLPM